MCARFKNIYIMHEEKFLPGLSSASLKRKQNKTTQTRFTHAYLQHSYQMPKCHQLSLKTGPGRRELTQRNRVTIFFFFCTPTSKGKDVFLGNTCHRGHCVSLNGSYSIIKQFLFFLIKVFDLNRIL